MSDQPGSRFQNHSLLASGKLPSDLLGELIGVLPTVDPRLLLGPSVGEDAAIIDFAGGDMPLLVGKSDPITFATDEIGYYAAVNKVGVRDLQATILNQIGLDPYTLSYPFNGLNARLIGPTDEAKLIKDILV